MEICKGQPPGGHPAATGHVRYVRVIDGAERIVGPYCDSCQVEMCTALRWRERNGEIRNLGAVPLDYRERLDEARRTGAVRRIADEITNAPGGPGEIADMIVAAIVERSATMLPVMVQRRLARHLESMDREDEGR